MYTVSQKNVVSNFCNNFITSTDFDNSFAVGSSNELSTK